MFLIIFRQKPGLLIGQFEHKFIKNNQNHIEIYMPILLFKIHGYFMSVTLEN